MSRKNERVEIMDLPFVNSNRKSFVQNEVFSSVKKKERCFIVTANPEIVMETRRDKQYKKIVQSANYIVPDGVGIMLAARRKRKPLQERIAGFDLFIDMLTLANSKGARCYFLGASEEVNEQTVINIKKKFPQIDIVGRHHGYFDLADAHIATEIEKVAPDFVFVALGFPKQEQWIARYLNIFDKGIFIGLGGSFDVIAGKVKRAPKLWIKLHLEWLYRIISQPFRLRRLFPLCKFLLLVIFKKV